MHVFHVKRRKYGKKNTCKVCLNKTKKIDKFICFKIKISV